MSIFSSIGHFFSKIGKGIEHGFKEVVKHPLTLLAPALAIPGVGEAIGLGSVGSLLGGGTIGTIAKLGDIAYSAYSLFHTPSMPSVSPQQFDMSKIKVHVPPPPQKTKPPEINFPSYGIKYNFTKQTNLSVPRVDVQSGYVYGSGSRMRNQKPVEWAGTMMGNQFITEREASRGWGPMIDFSSNPITGETQQRIYGFKNWKTGQTKLLPEEIQLSHNGVLTDVGGTNRYRGLIRSLVGFETPRQGTQQFLTGLRPMTVGKMTVGGGSLRLVPGKRAEGSATVSTALHNMSAGINKINSILTGMTGGTQAKSQTTQTKAQTAYDEVWDKVVKSSDNFADTMRKYDSLSTEQKMTLLNRLDRPYEPVTNKYTGMNDIFDMWKASGKNLKKYGNLTTAMIGKILYNPRTSSLITNRLVGR